VWFRETRCAMSRWVPMALTALACVTVSVLVQPVDGKKNNDREQFPGPPKGFATCRDGIDRGELETVEYDSAKVGGKRRARIYTPPGYTKDSTYPVLYLLHGIGGVENEWARAGAPDLIRNNLHADRKIMPMIVV